MTHPASLELMEYLKGELDAQRHQGIQQHLDGCDACINEVEQLQAFASGLAEWNAPELSEEAVDSIKAGGYKAFQASNAPVRTVRLTIRKVLTAAAIIMLTFLFQSLVWNPFKPVIAYSTTVTLIPSMLSIPTADAATSTSLYLTVHPNQKVSTQHLDGQHRLEDLAGKLIEAGVEYQFESILIMGSDPTRPIMFETDYLDDLQKSLGIDSVEFGPGLISFEVHDRFIGKLLYRAGTPSYPALPEFEMRPRMISIDTADVRLSPGVQIILGTESDIDEFNNYVFAGYVHATLWTFMGSIINRSIFALWIDGTHLVGV